MKLTYFFLLIYSPFLAFSQTHIDFRNCLNEGTYYFYEESFDSAYCYYHLAEKDFDFDFYYEEVHLYSRTLWEIGKKRKALKLLKSFGNIYYFSNDTSYYKGLSSKSRQRTLRKMPDVATFNAPDKTFFDSLASRDQRYRGIRNLDDKGTKLYDSITRLMLEMDSINAVLFLDYVDQHGFPSGYVHCPPITVTFLLHTSRDWFDNNQTLLMNEIKLGNMDPEDYAIVYDRIYGYSISKDSTIYDRYLSKEITISPELLFQNCIKIGLSPYYDNRGNRIFTRGNTPKKTRYFEYFMTNKSDFRCY